MGDDRPRLLKPLLTIVVKSALRLTNLPFSTDSMKRSEARKKSPAHGRAFFGLSGVDGQLNR
jgi:hypothetical protein